MALKFVAEIILLLKVHRFEGIVNRSKINRMVNDHSSSCNLWRFKKIYANIVKNRLQFLAMPTSTTTDAMALNFFADTMKLLKS